MKTDSNLKTRVNQAAPTIAQGKAAYACWLLIKSEGWERARNNYPRTSWYRNLKILRIAGLSDSDISSGNIVQFRRRIIEASIVTDWSELEAA